FTTAANGTVTPNKPGINGVTVSLTDAGGRTLASTVTMPSPVSYPYLPPNTSGWYQFAGLCPGTYGVSFDANQPALSGLILDVPAIGQSYPTMANQANNFGFTGYAPLNVSCAATTGTASVAYSSAVIVSGGVSPFSFTLSGGALPPGLTLNPSTGAIAG